MKINILTLGKKKENSKSRGRKKPEKKNIIVEQESQETKNAPIPEQTPEPNIQTTQQPKQEPLLKKDTSEIKEVPEEESTDQDSKQINESLQNTDRTEIPQTDNCIFGSLGNIQISRFQDWFAAYL